MSGTRKMEKFELEAYGTPAPEEPPPPSRPSGESVAHPPVRPPSVSGSTEKDEPSVVVKKAPEPQDAAALRTRLAAKFVDLASDVNDAFAEFSIGAAAWAVELTTPQGMSTGGGKQALQHLRLRPRREGYSVLVGGTVNQVEKTAELRDYEHMRLTNEVRFRRRLEITENEWEQFLRKAEVVLEKAGVECARVGPPKDLVKQRASMVRINKIAAIVLVTVLVLAAIVVWRIVVSETS
jgi:hypothetical protein